MRHVAFVAPHFLANTNRFVRALAQLPEVALSVISQDGTASIPRELKPMLHAHWRVDDAFNGHQLGTAVRGLSRLHGAVDRLLGALEELQLPLALARESAGVPGLGLTHATRFRDKHEMKRVLREAQVPVAKSVLATTTAQLWAFAEESGYPLIVKPPLGLGSRGTHRVQSARDLAALALSPSASQPVQIEQFIRAREFTCETVTLRGRHVWHSGTRYFPTPLEVLETPWVQYCVLMPKEATASPWGDFHRLNQRALSVLFEGASAEGATALTHMEWFLQNDGTMVVGEVAARPPGVHIMPMMGLAHETDALSDWARLMALDRFEPKVRQHAAGACFFRGQGEGSHVASVSGLERAIEAAGETLVEMRTPKIGQPRAAGYEGEGWAIVRAATTERAKAALLGLVQSVRVRYHHVRD
jgi:biotin carboxylase